jgi:hypothetical protein
MGTIIRQETRTIEAVYKIPNGTFKTENVK